MDNKEVRLECSPKLQKGHSKVNCADPPLLWVNAFYVKCKELQEQLYGAYGREFCF